MLRLNLRRIAMVFFCTVAILFNSVIISCKSTASLEKVNPLDLLEPGSTVYLSVPVQSNFEFTKYLFSSIVAADKNISSKDVENILRRLDDFCVAIDVKTSKIQIATSGNFPLTLSKLMLTEKNGWSKEKIASHNCYSNKSMGFLLSLVTSDLACVSSETSIMDRQLSRYDSILSDAEIDKVDFEVSDKDISFYFPDAKDAMALFFGGFSLGGIKSVSGKFVQIPDTNSFNMSVDLSLLDSRMGRAVTGLLSIGLIGSGAKVELQEADTVSVKNLRFDWEDFISLVSVEIKN